jgi:RimJ/RimL family protein N-acetyltransferase
VTVIRGKGVVLRPLREDEAAVLFAFWEADAAGRVGPATPAARRRLERRIGHRGRFREGRIDLAVEAGEELVGQIEARQPRDAMPTGVFELGIALFEERRGKGYGSEAIRLLTSHLFAEMDARRVQASTAAANVAMRRVFEKLGFVEEGVLRGFIAGPDGVGEDYVLYAVTREDWTA